MSRVHVNPTELPTPIGPFSYGVSDEGTVYVSGCVGTDENWKVIGKGDVTAQTEKTVVKS